MSLFKFLTVLLLSGLLVLEIVPIVFGKEIPTPGVYSTPQEYQKITGKQITKFNEAPILTELVKQGKLPPVTKRLPSEPLVVNPIEEVGRYGGTVKVLYTNLVTLEDGLNIMREENILTLDHDGYTIRPNIAKSWIFSKDGKTLILELRKDMKWSDGQPFTADDILFWYEDVFLNDELTPVRPYYWCPGGRPMKLKKLGTYDIRIEFAIPHPTALMELARRASQGSFYLPKHYLKQFHPRYTPKDILEKKTKDAGFQFWYQLFSKKADTGTQMDFELPTVRAFRPVKRSLDTTIFERNPYYWKVDIVGNQLPYIDGFRMTLVQNVEVYNMKVITGEVDLAQWNTSLENYSLYKENEDKCGYRVLLWNVSWPSVVELMPNFNHKDPVLREILRDKRFRIALSLAINREEINQMVFHGLGEPLQVVILPRDGRFWDEKLAKLYTEYNPKESNRLLDEIGLKKGVDGYRLRPDGKRLELTIEYWPGEAGPAKTSIVELVQRYWENIGIKTAIKSEERSLRQTRIESASHDFTLWHTGMCTDPTWIVEPWHYIPIYRFNTYAPDWALWYSSKGKSGEEPTSDVKMLYTLWDKMKTTLSEEERVKLGKEIIRSHVENLRTIGTVGNVPQPVIVNKKLRNIPEKGLLSWDWFYLGLYYPEQFFFKQD